MPSSTSRHGSPNPDAPGRLLLSWAGLLAGPILFLTVLQLNYVLSYVACGTQQKWLIHVSTVCAAAIVAVAGYLGWRLVDLDSQPNAKDSEDAGRTHATDARALWMGYAGALASAYFVIAILSMVIPAFIYKPCQ